MDGLLSRQINQMVTWTSGRINVLFALVAVQHLRDAGLSRDGDMIEAEFMRDLTSFMDPTDYTKTGRDIAKRLLR
jgi:hypothetical protein